MGGMIRYLPYDGALVSSETDLGKELMKWERKSNWTPEANPFPRMLYRAQHRPDGRRSVHEIDGRLCVHPGEQVQPNTAEQWSARCQLTVRDEAEMQRAFENGWRKTPQEALDYLKERDDAVAKATAERHYSDLRMSPQAQAEAAAADEAAGLQHVPEIPEKPRVKRKYVRREPAQPQAAAAYPVTSEEAKRLVADEAGPLMLDPVPIKRKYVRKARPEA